MHTLPTISSLLDRAARVGLTAIDVAARTNGAVSAHRLSRLRRTGANCQTSTISAVMSAVSMAEIERMRELVEAYPNEARSMVHAKLGARGPDESRAA